MPGELEQKSATREAKLNPTVCRVTSCTVHFVSVVQADWTISSSKFGQTCMTGLVKSDLISTVLTAAFVDNNSNARNFVPLKGSITHHAETPDC